MGILDYMEYYTINKIGVIYIFGNSKKRLIIAYPNGLLDIHSKFVLNDNEIITKDGKQIIHKRNHAYLDKNGTEYFFVNGYSDNTQRDIGPLHLTEDIIDSESNITVKEMNDLNAQIKRKYGTFKLFGGKEENKIFDRESMEKVHKNLIIKSMHQMNETPKLTLILIALTFTGVGWMACDALGNNEIYHQEQYNENYFPNAPGNDTVIVNLIKLDFIDNLNILNNILYEFNKLT